MPVREWLLSLSDDDRKTIGDDIRTAASGWHAALPSSHRVSWLMGNSQQRNGWPNRPRAALRSSRANGVTARLHQEDTTDAAP